ncbi:hypothetical protein [Bradyrhizobium sp. UFLA05-112]
MSARTAEREVAAHAVRVVPVTTSVPAFGGTHFLTSFNAGGYISQPQHGTMTGNVTISNVTLGFSFAIHTAGGSVYDSDFVADILAADAAEPEASFDNVVDMLEWLNRD